MLLSEVKTTTTDFQTPEDADEELIALRDMFKQSKRL